MEKKNKSYIIFIGIVSILFVIFFINVIDNDDLTKKLNVNTKEQISTDIRTKVMPKVQTVMDKIKDTPLKDINHLVKKPDIQYNEYLQKQKISHIQSKIVISERELEKEINKINVDKIFHNYPCKKKENVFINGGIVKVSPFKINISNEKIILNGVFKTHSLRATYKPAGLRWLGGRSTVHLTDTIIKVQVQFKPTIVNNWYLKDNNIKVTVKLSGAHIKFGFLSTSKFNHSIEELLKKQIIKKFRNGFSIRKSMAKSWKKLYVNKQLHNKQLWLFISPKELSISKFDLSNHKLSLFLNIDSEVQVTSKKIIKQDILPLPPYKYNSSKGNFEINIPIKLNYNDLSNYFNKDKKLKNIKDIELSNLNIYPHVDKLVFSFDFKYKNHTGKLYLAGKPIYDKDLNQLQIINLDYDLETKNMLDKIMDKTYLSYLLIGIEEKLIYPISKLDKYKTIFTKELKNNISLSVTINDILVNKVYLDKNNLVLTTSFIGNSILSK